MPLPAEQTAGWRLLDIEDKELTSVDVRNATAHLGRLPVGFYRLKSGAHSNWVSCAVLAPLKTPTPSSSPIALDVAMSWFYSREKMEAVSSLCALAGINWVRDRLAWRELEPQRAEWAGPTRYDDAARIQSEFGLRVLQVNHLSPPWANPTASRFPLDLRDAYRFYREMARRWRGQVLAFEPWNEADIEQFGGHTGAEMAAMQKASYLGLKSGAAKVIACLNVFALHDTNQLADLRENEAWPYFDTFNLHHYAPFDEYPRLYADFREVCAGRPLWVTECALPVKWAGDESLKEPSDADLRVQAERVAKTFACSLHEGAAATFYFLLPHFVEGQTQFGLLRPDLTPRPAYVALAAVGRLLADAKPKGRLSAAPPNVRGFLFRASPEGQSTNALVVWSTDGPSTFALPNPPGAVFNHFGRLSKAASTLELGSAPLFVLLPDAVAKQLPLQPPPQLPPWSPGDPSPVVMQATWPHEKISLSQSAYRISSQKRESLPLFIYNFSDSPVAGRLTVATPTGWQAGSLNKVEIAAQSRIELQLQIDCMNSGPSSLGTLRVTGDFGPASRPVLSVRLLPEPSLR